MPRYIEVIRATTETATKILALRTQTTGRTLNVTTWGGKTASVDWSPDQSTITLNMPSLPPDSWLTRAEADRLVAFIAHECCHVLHTDRSAWERACHLGPRVRDWTNALEDVRIEATEIRAGHFPGLQGLLSGMANHLHYEAVTDAGSNATIGARVANAPYVACILGRLANSYTIPAAGGLIEAMSVNVAKLLAVALPGLNQCRNTDDVRYLAEQLVAMETAQQPPQQPNQPEPSDEGEGEGDSPQDEGEGEGDSPQGEGDSPQGEGEGDSPQGEGGQGNSGQGTSGAGIASDASLAETIDKIADRAGIQDLGEYVATNRGSIALPLIPMRINSDKSGYSGTKNTIAADALTQRLPRNSVLHGQIGRLLVSAEMRRVTHHESYGRLDRRALARMRTGATDVYSRREEIPGIDTALMVLIDGSSSMRHAENPTGPTRMGIAQTAAWHISRAAEAANAKVAVCVFYGLNSGTTLLTIVKPWETPVALRAGNLAAVDGNGGTPLAPAILAAADMLGEVNATRRVLMVLTDGDCDYGPDAVTRACTIAADLGVETVGIGMACAAVTAAFPKRYSVNVENLAQLAQTGLGVLVRMLEDANPAAAD